MGTTQPRDPITGAGGRSPVIHRAGPRQPYPVLELPADVPCDPVRAFVALLEAGLTPEQVWPACSTGFEALLQSTPKRPVLEQREQPLTPAWSDSYPTEMRRLQEILRRHRTGDATAPSTAIRAHRDLDGMISAAQEIICTPDWFLDPSAAVLVCSDQSEAAEVEALLRRDYDLERGEDLLESARALAEGLMVPSPGWCYSGTPPVVIAAEIQPGGCWREVFLAPRCRGLQADQLLPAVGAARVGVHVVAVAQPPGAGSRKASSASRIASRICC